MPSIIQSRQAKLARTLSEFTVAVETLAGNILNDRIILRLTDQDKLRLFKLQVWSWRYKVTVAFILQELITFWSARMPARFKRQRGRLGVRIATLTNVKSHEFLTGRLEELYPAHENEQEWKMSQQRALVPSSGSRLFTVNDPMLFMKHYKARILSTRRQIDANARKLSRRAFRDNPFI